MFQFQFLLPPIAAMMSIAFLLSSTMRHFHAKKYEQLAFGGMIGCVIVLGMTNPIPLGEGLILDMRTLLIGAATVFVGPVAGVIAMAFGVIGRLYIGGAGTISGIVGLLLALGLAMIWRQKISSLIKHPVAHDVALGLFITLSVNALFVLPRELALSLLVTIAPMLILSNTLGMVAIGYVFRRENAYFMERKTMRAQAQTDALTTLLNRHGMETAIDGTQFDAARGHALLYFDIDDFKSINDRYGHEVGDATLAIIAARLNVIIRGGAVFARQGGDEFSIYFPSLSSDDVQGIANRLCIAISDQQFSHSDTRFPVSITLGGFWSKTDLPIEHMIRRADAELLLAKTAGKNRARIAYDHIEGKVNVA